MTGETVITIVGNLVDEVELRFTPAGVAVAKFRVASTPRTFDRQANEWKDGEPLFLTCSVWRQAAENTAETLAKGMRVIVQGRLKQRSYDDREGVKRTVYELDVDEVGPSLQYASAVVTKKAAGGQQQNGRPASDGWGGARPAQQQAPAGDGWSTTQPPAGQQQSAPATAGQSEPPF